MVPTAGAGGEAWEADEPPLGLGDEDLPGFPADECPEELPDLKHHHSALAEVLRDDPTIYGRLRGRSTRLGVGLARCIKVGMDNRGHRVVKPLGVVAGDAECYDTFRELFDPVIARKLSLAAPAKFGAPQPTDFGHGSGSSVARPDPTGKYVLSSQVYASRNLTGIRFTPAMSREERLEVERLLSGALEQSGAAGGAYLPLLGSQSHAPVPGGMDVEEEQSLRDAGMLFEAPDSKLLLSTGLGRHWPDGRGVFANSERTLVAWVNEQEHLRLSVLRKDDAVGLALARLAEALTAVEAALGPGRSFARSERLGFLTSSPANLGTAMQVSVTIRLPRLAKDPSGDWREWCAGQRVVVRGARSAEGLELPGVFELSNMDRLGASEVAAAAAVAKAARHLVELEQKLEVSQLDSVLDKRRLSVDLAKMAAPGVASALREAHAAAVSVVAKVTRRSLCIFTGVEPPSKGAQLDDVLDRRRLSVDPAKLAAAGVAPELREAHSAAVEAVARAAKHSLLSVAGLPPQQSAELTACARGAPDHDELRILQCARETVAEAVACAVRCQFRPPAQDPKPSEAEAGASELTAARLELAKTLGTALESGALQSAMDEVGSELQAKDPKPPATERRTSELAPARSKLVKTFEAALESGALQIAMDEVSSESRAKELAATAAKEEAAATARAAEAVAAAKKDGGRLELLLALQGALDSGRLRAAMEEVGAEAGSKEAGKCEASRPQALAAFLRLSGQDRRLGELQGLLAATTRRLAERTENLKKVEEMLKQAKAEREHLELSIEQHKQAIEEAEARSEELEASHRKLGLTAGHLQPQRSVEEPDELKAGFSVSSDLSTATGATVAMGPLSANGAIFTPLPGLQPAFEPIAPHC